MPSYSLAEVVQVSSSLNMPSCSEKKITDTIFLTSLLMGVTFTCTHTPSKAFPVAQGESSGSSRCLQTCIYMLLEVWCKQLCVEDCASQSLYINATIFS